MTKHVCSWMGIWFLLSTISGCTMINASGKKDNNFHGEVQSMLIVFDDVWRPSPGTPQRFSSSTINQFVQYISNRGAYRMPVVFRLNNISTRVVRTSTHEHATQDQIESLKYIMTIQPASVTGNKYGLVALDINAKITQVGSPTPIWEGQFSFKPSMSALGRTEAMDDSVDELAHQILLQLKTDEMIRIPTETIQMPPERKIETKPLELL